MKSTAEIQKQVTERIIQALDNGVVPWQKPWTGGGLLPMNYVSKKAYQGINFIMCMLNNFESPYYLTKKQINDRGGSIMKGCKGTLIVYWNFFDKSTTKPDGEVKIERIPFLKFSYVWNEEQISGIKFEKPVTTGQYGVIEAAENIIKAMPSLPQIKESASDRAYYSPTFDYVQMPKREQFRALEGFYCTLNHELIHSTGHKSRVGRVGIENFDYKGSHQYSFEELIAEMGAAMLNSLSGISNETIERNNAAYIAHWREKISNDNKLIFKAASAAKQAVDFILGTNTTEAAGAES